MCNTLGELGHPQPIMTIHKDNKTADVIINNKIVDKATK